MDFSSIFVPNEIDLLDGKIGYAFVVKVFYLIW